MARSVAQAAAFAALLSVVAVSSFAGPGPRHATAVERYGLEGHVQPIGLHHGFHIVRVMPGSPAERDRLVAHDVIVKVDGELIRSLEHLQTLLSDADEDDGKVVLTILKNGSLEHHVVNADLRARERAKTADGQRNSDGSPRR
ncbi:MAG: PDZ domain-containing protein [Isosphaeraceae bacterium]|nr:PDZ domain-containing protein [Isosphaeraceae bacterium]